MVADVTLTGRGRDACHRLRADDMERRVSLCPLAGTDMFQIQAPVPLEGELDLSADGLTVMVATRTGRHRDRYRLPGVGLPQEGPSGGPLPRRPRGPDGAGSASSRFTMGRGASGHAGRLRSTGPGRSITRRRRRLPTGKDASAIARSEPFSTGRQRQRCGPQGQDALDEPQALGGASFSPRRGPAA